MESPEAASTSSSQPIVQLFLPGDQLKLSDTRNQLGDRNDNPIPITPRLETKESIKTHKRKRVLHRSVESDIGTGGEGSTRSKSSRKKPKRIANGPDAYAHLHPLQDYLDPGLDVVFCGINPGCLSAATGHHFANPTNHFWRCLHRSGMTSVLVPASEDYSLPERFKLGLTNLVERPSTQASELTRAEMTASVPSLFNKLARHRPRFVCFVGVVIWEIVRGYLSKRWNKNTARTEKGKNQSKRQMGLQPYKLVYDTKDSDVRQETLFFVVPCTSGRVVHYQTVDDQLGDKIGLFTELKRLMETTASDMDTSEMERVHWDSCT